MPSKMTSKEWKALLPKDKEVLKTLGIFNLVKPKEKKTPKSKALPPLEPYVLKRIGICSVCESAFTKYFRMAIFPGKSFLFSTEIKQEAVLPEDTIKRGRDLYSGCPYCFEILSKMTKEELIKKIIRRK